MRCPSCVSFQPESFSSCAVTPPSVYGSTPPLARLALFCHELLRTLKFHDGLQGKKEPPSLLMIRRAGQDLARQIR